MDIKNIFTDEDAVSPVIGVILMVAITVILAAVIGTFVLGLGDQVQQNAPQASFNFEFTEAGGTFGGADDSVEVTHDGGDVIEEARLTVLVGGTAEASLDSDPAWTDSNVGAGDTWSYTESSTNDLGQGSEVRVTWTSNSGDNTATLGKSTAPDQ